MTRIERPATSASWRRKWPGVIVLLVGLLVVFVVMSIIFIPFGIAEPGQPHGFGPIALMWSFGEMVWTVFAFARPKHDHASFAARVQGVAIVVAGIAAGSILGLSIFDRDLYNGSAWTAAFLFTFGCRAGRYRLSFQRPTPGRTSAIPVDGV